MKRCPTCQKEFPDSMRFCQTDGTRLPDAPSEAAAPPDPFKTIVGAPVPEDPFKTVVGGAPPKQSAPEEPADSMKTMVVSQDDIKSSIPPPNPFGDAPKPGDSLTPEPPKFSEPSLSPPPLGDLSGSSSPFSPPKESPSSFDQPNNSPFGAPPNDPLSSPFGAPPKTSFEPSPFDQPSSYDAAPSPFDNAPSPFDAPQTPSYKEPEPFGSNAAPDPFGQSPFGSNAPQNEWSPPPAPISDWQNQGLGANTPFQTPPVSSGQNQTLAIAALVCGILSCLCCFSVITGPAGLIMGYIAKGKADTDPANFGGRGLALGGMITGGIGTLIGILVIVLQVLGAFAGRF